MPVTAAVLSGLADLVHERIRQGEPLHIPRIGTLVPQYRRQKRVVSSLPGMRNRVFIVPLRVVPFLKPAKSLRRDWPVVPGEVRTRWWKQRERREAQERLGDVIG
jgi:hypothetical protein